MSSSPATAIAAPDATRRDEPAPRRRLPPGVAYVLVLALALRLALSLVAAWVLSLRAPHVTALVRAQYLGQTPLHDRIVGPWERFDAFWYLRLAAHGYGAHDGSTVYFPLYPLLIRGLSGLVGGQLMLAALVVSNLCFVGLLLALYRVVAARHGDGAARRSVLLLCLLPTSFFLLAPYTESLFLVLVVGVFLAAADRRYLLAGALGLLAALTRLQGVVLALPLAWLAWQCWREGRRDLRPWLAAALPALGTLLFMAYTRLVVHSGPVTAVYAGQVHQQLNLPWGTLAGYWSALAAHHFRVFAYPTGNWVDLMNLALALGMLALVIPARRVIGTPLWLYALATWFATLCIHQSTARYMLSVFPALIALAVWAPARWTTRLALALGAPLMLFCAAEFVQWSFVG